MQIYMRELQEKRSFSERGSEKENIDGGNCEMRPERDEWQDEGMREEMRVGLKQACDSGNAFRKVVSRVKEAKEVKEAK